MFGRLFLINAVVLLVFMTGGWLVAKRRNRLDTVDTAWGLGFILVAWIAEIYRPSPRSLVIAALVTTWGLRLSWHLWQRNQDRPDDRRYRELSDKWQGDFWRRAYISIFSLQGALVWLISLPVMVATGPQLLSGNLQTLAGTWVWLVGFGFEALADQQLAAYMRTKKHPKILQTGLWRYSRHPNYFGELAQWWGIGLIALQSSYGWLGLIGPLTLTVLIVFISGIMPIERRHAKEPAYRDYRRQTSVLIPWPPQDKQL
jgi:steroid 5-alpha reductase family enzyme